MILVRVLDESIVVECFIDEHGLRITYECILMSEYMRAGVVLTGVWLGQQFSLVVSRAGCWRLRDVVDGPGPPMPLASGKRFRVGL